MKIILVAAALLAAPVAASAATTIDFDTVAIGVGNLTYSADYSGVYNYGTSAPATVPGVTFAGTSGVDFGRFGFTSNGTQTAFLQSYMTTTGGSFALTGLGLHSGRYSIGFDSVSRGGGGVAFTVSQGSTLLGTFYAGGSASFASQSLNFVSSGSGALTFAVISESGDHSTAIDNINVSAVPEPATWGLMLAGFALTGFATRRRRTGVVAA